MDKTLNRTQHSVSERRQFRPFSRRAKFWTSDGQPWSNPQAKTCRLHNQNRRIRCGAALSWGI